MRIKLFSGNFKRGILIILAIFLSLYELKEYLGFYFFYSFKRFYEKFEGKYEERVEKGISLLSKAVSLKRDPEIYKGSGEFFYEIACKENELGNKKKREEYIDKAIENFRNAIKLVPVDPFAYFGAGKSYLLSNFPHAIYADKAKIYFRIACELTPNDEFILYHTAKLYISQWKFLEKDEKEFTKSLVKRLLNLNEKYKKDFSIWWENFAGEERIFRFQ